MKYVFKAIYFIKQKKRVFLGLLLMGVILPNIFRQINHQLEYYPARKGGENEARTYIAAINRAEQAFYQERQKDERNNKNFSCDLKAYSKNKNCIETRSARYKASLLQSSPSKGGFLLPSAFLLMPSELEKNNFTSRLEDLELGIRSETKYYHYSILRADNLQAIATAAAKKDGFKSYIGAVFLVKNADGSYATLTVSCETTTPSKTPPVTPEISGNDIECPSDSQPTSHFSPG